MSSRNRWGITSPTKATRPHADTVALTINEVRTRSVTLTRLTLTPMELAISFPISSRFMELDSQNMTIKHGSTIAAIRRASLLPADDRSPISQNMMLWIRESWVREIRNMITAEQNALTMTPESNRASFLSRVLPVA